MQKLNCMVLLTTFFLIFGTMSTVIADQDSYNPYGGGIVSGRILGFNYFNELIPVAWAEVSAWQDGELINKGYSMAGGYYEIILPVGWFILKVEEPGFETQSREIFVSSASSTKINFFLELSKEPVHKPKPLEEYVLQIVTSGFSSDIATQLYVDDLKEADLVEGEIFQMKFPVNSIHNVSVSKILEKDDERYFVDKSFIMISEETFHEFKYRVEYFLSFTMEPRDLSLPIEPKSGWYDAGVTIVTPKAPVLIDGPQGLRYRFSNWKLDSKESNTNPIEFVMDKPHSLQAVYVKEYLIEVSSNYGTAEGSGWYADGSTVVISSQQNEGFLIRYKFEGWSGDFTSSEPTVSFTADRPMRIIASWSTDYTPLFILIAIIVAILAVVLIVVYRRFSS